MHFCKGGPFCRKPCLNCLRIALARLSFSAYNRALTQQGEVPLWQSTCVNLQPRFSRAASPFCWRRSSPTDRGTCGPGLPVCQPCRRLSSAASGGGPSGPAVHPPVPLPAAGGAETAGNGWPSPVPPPLFPTTRSWDRHFPSPATRPCTAWSAVSWNRSGITARTRMPFRLKHFPAPRR